jgi:hypothetical protein
MTMKYLAIALLSTISMAASAAPALKTDLGVYGNWRAAEITGHAFFGKNVCVAYTQTADGKNTLEVYAEEQADPANGYTEPTVIVVTEAATPAYIRGVMADNKKLGELHMTLLTNRATPTGFGVMARIDQRAKMIDIIKKAGTVDIRLGGVKNKLVKTLKFSLKGSTKAVDAIMKGCGLTLE